VASALREHHTPPALRPTQPAPAASASRVTELVIPGGDQQAILLPMVRYLSEQSQQQWLTLISHGIQEQRWLKAQGVNPQTLRVIQGGSQNDILWMTWEALTNGTSHTVVAELGAQPLDVMKELERAAEQGHCRLILVRNR
jgi:cell division inhibitor SulA